MATAAAAQLFKGNLKKALAGLRRIDLEGLRWRVFDAKGQVLGRLASQIATVVQGKDKPTYAPNRDDGDMCVVLNAKDVCTTGRKMTDKFYRWHTGYVGHLKERSLKDQMAKDPTEVIRKAVLRMLPRNKLRDCLRNFSAHANSSEANVMENKLQILGELAPFQNRFFRSGITGNNSFCRSITTVLDHPEASLGQDNSTSPDVNRPQHIKFKRLDKTAKHIMNILDKEAVEKVQVEREIPDIRPGYIVQLKVEVPENKRRVSILKGIVIARRNAGLNTTFRLRRLVAGVGVESVFPLYSPNIKEMKVLDRKKVRRAKLYYLRDRMNPLKK